MGEVVSRERSAELLRDRWAEMQNTDLGNDSSAAESAALALFSSRTM